MYKLCPEYMGNPSKSVIRTTDGACIPTDPDNTDYQAFKQDLANGVALSDAEGTAMTADQIKTFLETLP
jgi:hypothetical protein